MTPEEIERRKDEAAQFGHRAAWRQDRRRDLRCRGGADRSVVVVVLRGARRPTARLGCTFGPARPPRFVAEATILQTARARLSSSRFLLA